MHLPQDIKAILFDFDDTLVKTKEVRVQALQEFATSRVFDPSLEFLNKKTLSRHKFFTLEIQLAIF